MKYTLPSSPAPVTRPDQPPSPSTSPAWGEDPGGECGTRWPIGSSPGKIECPSQDRTGGAHQRQHPSPGLTSFLTAHAIGGGMKARSPNFRDDLGFQFFFLRVPGSTRPLRVRQGLVLRLLNVLQRLRQRNRLEQVLAGDKAPFARKNVASQKELDL